MNEIGHRPGVPGKWWPLTQLESDPQKIFMKILRKVCKDPVVYLCYSFCYKRILFMLILVSILDSDDTSSSPSDISTVYFHYKLFEKEKYRGQSWHLELGNKNVIREVQIFTTKYGRA